MVSIGPNFSHLNRLTKTTIVHVPLPQPTLGMKVGMPTMYSISTGSHSFAPLCTTENQSSKYESWSPGLVVMGGDKCSKGREFESQHHILDGHFFTYLFVVKFVMFV